MPPSFAQEGGISYAVRQKSTSLHLENTKSDWTPENS